MSGKTSKVTLNSLLPSDRYWEEVVSCVDTEGSKQMYCIVFARVKIGENDFKKAVNNAIKKNKNKEPCLHI